MKSCFSFLKCFAISVAMAMALVASAQAQVDPVTVEVHYQNGVKYFKRGLYEKSTQEFEKTLSLDPSNAEAKAYLDQIRQLGKSQKPVEAAASQGAEVRQLNDEGRVLFKKGEYEKAKDVFSKVLEVNPVDDLASSYREQCEIRIAQKIAREKKSADKQKAKERAQGAKQEKIAADAAKKADRQEMLVKRAVIKEEQKVSRQKPAVAAPAPAEGAAAASAAEPGGTKAEIKKQQKEKLAYEKQLAEAQKREAKIRERDEKIQAKAEREARARQEKAAAREAKNFEKQQGAAKKNKKKLTPVEAREDRERHKVLFIKGVEQYGKRDYAGAIATFDELIEKEAKSEVVYTNSAKRLKSKAELRLKGVGEDKQI